MKFLFLILVLSIVGISSFLSIRKPIGFWTLQMRKFVISSKHYYEQNVSTTAYEKNTLKFPPNPWELIGKPCDYDAWKKQTWKFVVTGEDYVEFQSRIKKTSASDLSSACLYPDSVPVLQCSKSTSKCECSSFKQYCLNHTPSWFVMDPNDASKCVGENGAMCDPVSGIIRCKDPISQDCDICVDGCNADFNGMFRLVGLHHDGWPGRNF